MSEVEVDELVDAYRQGASVNSLARRFEIHRTTVLAHLRRRGVPRRGSTRKMSDEQVVEAARRYRSGDSLRTVADRFGVDSRTLTREFKKARVQVRARNGRPTDPVLGS